MTAQGKRLQAGFTLLEVMLAGMILIVALVSVLALSSQAFGYLSDMRRWARSTQVLQQKMEDIRLYTNWPSVLALNNTKFTNTSIDISGTRTNQWIGTITIASFSPYTTDQTVSVTTSVTWSNRSGRSVLTNSMSTLICNGGLDKYIF